MRFTLNLIILFSFLYISVSCESSVTHNFKEVREMLDTQPDSALILLYELEKEYPQMEDGEKALFGLLYFEALYELEEDINSEQYLNYSLQYFKKNNKRNKPAYTYYQIGCVYFNNRNLSESANMLLHALDVCKPEDIDLIGKIYVKLGKVSSYQFETEHALKYYNQAIECFEKLNNINKIAQVNSNIGDTYTFASYFQQAISYQNKAINLSTDSVIIGKALENIAHIYDIEEKYDSALIYLYESIKFPYYSKDKKLRLTTIAHTYYEMEQYDSAKVYYNKALNDYSNIYADNGCLERLIEIDNIQGNKESALLYTNKLKTISDSLQVIMQLQNNLNMESSTLMQSNIKDVEKIHNLEKTNKKGLSKRIYLLVSIVILIITFVFAIYWFIRKSRRHKEYTKNYRNIIEKTQKENKQVKEELQQKQEDLIEKLNKELQLTKAKYQKEYMKGEPLQREDITKKVYQEVFLYNSPNEFINKMNKSLNNVPNKLTESYPNAIQKDILWCCLHLLNVPSSDMCLVMDYKPTSLYKFKQRLYKKWGFNNVTDFESMLQKLLFDF